ncbi:MAG: PAS domain S-box protein, partial [Candidatus Tectomicrobia bacterium]|nr:PAS domain S-box protein [Candidatus Tectomicrobia bacterium]
RMPGIGGLELLQMVRNQYEEIQVIMMTAIADFDVAIEAIRAGASDYITKPFHVRHMLVSIERALEKQELIRSNRAYQRDLETKVKERTEELKEARDYLFNLLENANDMMYTADPEGRFTYINQRVEEWGYERFDLIGEPLGKIFTEEPTQKIFTQVVTEGIKQSYEVEIRDKEGNIRLGMVSLSPVKDREGAIREVLGIVRDKTEEKKIQEQAVISEKLASIGRLTAGISHEIMNPLNIISGRIQLLMMKPTLDPDVSRALTIMQEQVERIAKITSNLMQLSQPAGQKKVAVNINQILEGLILLVQDEFKYHNIKIETDFDPDLPGILGDKGGLEQVFLNLMTNARDAISSEGTLTLTTRRLSSRSEKGQEEAIQITFRDTGHGVPESLKSRLFDPFFTTRPTGKGAGLGLYVSYGIIKEHGGTISVDSRVDKGTAFTIQLPVNYKG